MAKDGGWTHSLPVFAGQASRSHERCDLDELRRRADAARAQAPDLSEVATVVQFAGFPRSGHSIVGSIIDAHRDAIVSHELDMLGLIEAGLPPADILALAAANSAEFEANGRYWNGHCYRVAGASGGHARQARVVGDKKGDWSVRHLAQRPELLDRLAETFPGLRRAWICVLRNPFDNVATLSLRRGQHYDRLKIESGSDEEFRRRLASDRGGVADTVSPEMIEDYAALADGIAALRASVPPADWLDIRHEDFVADPVTATRGIFDFLGLSQDDAVLDRVRALVAVRPNRSRLRIGWNAGDRERVEEIVERHPFLAGYAFKEAAGTIRLLSCVGIPHDRAFIGHYIAHYAGLGVAPEHIHLIVNVADAAAPELQDILNDLGERGLPDPEIWVGAYTSGEMWERRRDLQRRVCDPEDWVISADIDELHVYPDDLSAVIDWMQDEGIDCLDGPMIDRVAADGTLAAVEPERSLQETFPVEADVMCPAGKTHGADDATGTCKIMLFRAHVEPSLGGHSTTTQGVRHAYRLPINRFPKIKTPALRFALPAYVAHFKWHAGLERSVTTRINTPGASPAGSDYGRRVLDFLAAAGGRIDLGKVPRRPAGQDPAENWRGRAEALRRQAPSVSPTGAAKGPAAPAPLRGYRWRVRQMTHGTARSMFHSHSYYDIPVLNEARREVVAYRSHFAERWMDREDRVTVGLVDLDRGGFRAIGVSTAWSWQQGPMAQWLPSGNGIVWNDRDVDSRDGAGFVARLHDLESGVSSTLPRPVYALCPKGRCALGINMARLDRARPGYGYVGGADPFADTAAPETDGIWRTDLDTGEERLLVSLARAREELLANLDAEERQDHLERRRIYWFNHIKFSPSGARFTFKLRWREAFEGAPWSGTMGMSMTAPSDGGAPRALARGTSHVIWWDEERLYFWHQSEGRFAVYRDAEPAGRPDSHILSDAIGANVHIRHVPDDPSVMIFDRPYGERVELAEVDLRSGRVQERAAFWNHRPPHGPFRCDLHPVPSADGRRVIVTSLHDGGRQLYAVEHESVAP